MTDSLTQRKKIAEFLFDKAEYLLESGSPDSPIGAVVAVVSDQGYRVFSTDGMTDRQLEALVTAVQDERTRRRTGLNPSKARRKRRDDRRRHLTQSVSNKTA